MVTKVGGRTHDKSLRGIAHVDWRGQHVSRLDFGIIFRPIGAHDEEGSAALGVTHIVQGLLSREIQDIVNRGRQIDGANLVPAELPEVRMLHIQPGVVPRVDIAAGIAQPDIVAGIRVVKRQRILRSIEQEAIGAAEQSVHDEHHRSGGFPGIV